MDQRFVYTLAMGKPVVVLPQTLSVVCSEDQGSVVDETARLESVQDVADPFVRILDFALVSSAARRWISPPSTNW